MFMSGPPAPLSHFARNQSRAFAPASADPTGLDSEEISEGTRKSVASELFVPRLSSLQSTGA
jgi:hypothetical protein